VGKLHGQLTHELHEHLVLLLELRELSERWMGRDLTAEPLVDRRLVDAVLRCSLGNGNAVILDPADDLLLDLRGDFLTFCHILGGKVVQSVSKIWGTDHGGAEGIPFDSFACGGLAQDKLLITLSTRSNLPSALKRGCQICGGAEGIRTLDPLLAKQML
jgi:hypothetical protein